MSASWWLKGEGGIASRVTAGGLLLGRSPHCDVVLRSELASRRHALVHLDEGGPQLVLLGRGGASLNGSAIENSAELGEGDQVQLPGVTLSIGREDDDGPPDEAVWLLEGPGGALFSVSRSPFCIGGAVEDDLRVESWPPGLLRLTTDGGLRVRAGQDVLVDGATLPSSETGTLRVGSRVEFAGAAIVVATGGQLGAGSTVATEAHGAGEVRLEFLPRGGRLHVSTGGAHCAVYLSDRRCDLIAVLLQPPEPFEAGDFVDDSQIISRVWGSKQHADRTHLNVLIHRVRKDLSRAGLDGPDILKRAEGGGATRFCLPKGAKVALD